MQVIGDHFGQVSFLLFYNQSACWCNCTEYFLVNEDAALPPGDADPSNSDPIRPIGGTNMEESLIPRTACGFQLHPGICIIIMINNFSSW